MWAARSERFSGSFNRVHYDFSLPFLLEPHKELCPSAATKKLSIISLKHAPKKMMQINQSRRSTHALETKTQCFQMQCPLAIRSSVAKEMVTRHRCLESSRISGGVVLDSLLIPFGLTSWKKASQIFHFSCVCVGKKGLCYVTAFQRQD